MKGDPRGRRVSCSWNGYICWSFVFRSFAILIYCKFLFICKSLFFLVDLSLLLLQISHLLIDRVLVNVRNDCLICWNVWHRLVKKEIYPGDGKCQRSQRS